MNNRRAFLQTSLAGASLTALFSRPAVAWNFISKGNSGNDVLDLRAGFQCKVISRSGATMSDGYRTPGQPDGMGCFGGPDGRYVLLRNHELDLMDIANGPYSFGQTPPDAAYDKRGMGGVTRVIINPKTLEVESSNLSLVGTVRNCGGGLSPWGWLTCEETIAEDHGYVFLCDTKHSRLSTPNRIVPYGRFNHEASSVDPRTNICYQTEDQMDSCFYRFLPAQRDQPFFGKLQALKIVGANRVNTGHGFSVGKTWACEWVDVLDPNPRADNVRLQSQERGAAIFVRGEGLWLTEDAAFFSCTKGGPASAGQIFKLTFASNELQLIAQSSSRETLDMPDNITVHDGKVYMAEDGESDQFIRVLKPDGSIVDLAKNKISRSEIAGLCFSPDGKVLFANIQKDGLTLAITGPFATI